VKKTAGSLDKELAASGFTRKEQVEMEKVGQMFSANLLFFFFGDFANLLFMHTFIDCFLAKLSDTFFLGELSYSTLRKMLKGMILGQMTTTMTTRSVMLCLWFP